MFFATPDFGESDILDLHIPMKYLLYQSLKENALPFWTQKLGDGFPLLAGLEIGALNPINSILFKFFPFVVAFNLIYVISFGLNALGTYFFCNRIKLSKPVSLYISIIYSFSGYFIAQIPHTDITQTVVFLPWYFYATDILIRGNKKILSVFFLSLVVVLSVFSTYPQIIFISIFASSLYALYLSINDFKQKHFLPFILFSLGILLGLVMGAAQLLPAYEFLQNSDRSGGLNLDVATYYSFPPQHLFTLIDPFVLGDPTLGTYPPFNNFSGSIFWENTGYIGLIPLLLAVFSIFIIKKNTRIPFFLLLLFLSFFLMLGHFTPFKYAYSLPFFSLFRVPSRFILLFVWSLVILAGISFEFIKTNINKDISKLYLFITFVFIFIFSIVDVQSYFYHYNPIIEANKILKPPKFVNMIDKSSGRVQTIGDTIAWNLIFYHGWQFTNMIPFMNNFMRQDNSALYAINQSGVYLGNTLSENTKLNNIVYLGLTLGKNKQIYISSPSLKLLLMQNISYLTSPFIINNSNIKQKATLSQNNLPSIYLSVLPTSKRAYIVHEKTIMDNEKAYSFLQSNKFNPWTTVILSNDDMKSVYQTNTNLKDKVIITKSTDQQIWLQTDTLSPGYLIISDTYYPGWKVNVNGKESKILLANTFEKAVYIPKGESVVRLYYYPESFVTGLTISISTFLLCMILLILVYKKRIKFY